MDTKLKPHGYRINFTKLINCHLYCSSHMDIATVLKPETEMQCISLCLSFLDFPTFSLIQRTFHQFFFYYNNNNIELKF